MNERNGVRKGQQVKDLDGKDLGKVTRLHAWGFETVKGLPVLIRDEYVFRYEEVRPGPGGALVVAKGANDIYALAEGKLPPSWNAVAPDGFPSVATPFEAARLERRGAKGRE
ncbi:MAG: hypothetical protein QM704_00230 [Anaeromyxobacteraceae bacterium]